MSLGNLLPGSGLGYSASRDLAFGLGPVSVTVIEPPVEPPIFNTGGGGYAGGGSFYPNSFHIYDNEYSKPNDDDEIMELISILIPILEQ